MLDHNPAAACDAHGFLCDPTLWDWDFSLTVADTLGLELLEEHKALILLIREFYSRFGHSPSMRPLVRFAQEQLSPSYTSLRFAQLFPERPAYTLARLAGLPKPAHCL